MYLSPTKMKSIGKKSKNQNIEKQIFAAQSTRSQLWDSLTFVCIFSICPDHLNLFLPTKENLCWNSAFFPICKSPFQRQLLLSLVLFSSIYSFDKNQGQGQVSHQNCNNWPYDFIINRILI